MGGERGVRKGGVGGFKNYDHGREQRATKKIIRIVKKKKGNKLISYKNREKKQNSFSELLEEFNDPLSSAHPHFAPSFVIC